LWMARSIKDMSAPTSCPARPLEGFRILAVDDNPDINDLVREILAEAGASVDTAESAPEAFMVFRRSRPHVILSDIAMPLEDGYALLRRVRELLPDQGGEVPAIALTAHARAEDRHQAFEAGFTRHLSKPVHPNELVAATLELLKAAAERP
jgi:CheY-like chemotaxis protein